MKHTNPPRETTPPLYHRRVTVELGNGERLELMLQNMSPETIEWLSYDCDRLSERLRKAADLARRMLGAIQETK